MAVPCPDCSRWLRPGTMPPRKEKAMPPEHSTPAGGVPRERSETQGILLKHMSQLNQRLLGPWEDAAGQRRPRLTLAEAGARRPERGTAGWGPPPPARAFCALAGP